MGRQLVRWQLMWLTWRRVWWLVWQAFTARLMGQSYPASFWASHCQKTFLRKECSPKVYSMELLVACLLVEKCSLLVLSRIDYFPLQFVCLLSRIRVEI